MRRSDADEREPDPASQVAYPSARIMHVIGGAWTIPVLYQILLGAGRFNQMQQNLGLPRETLSRRLRSLLANGLIERQPGWPGAARDEYTPTQKAQSLHEPIIGLMLWGAHHVLNDQKFAISLRCHTCNKSVAQLLVCPDCRKRVKSSELVLSMPSHLQTVQK